MNTSQKVVIIVVLSVMVGVFIGISLVNNFRTTDAVCTLFQPMCEKVCNPNGGLEEAYIDGDCLCKNYVFFDRHHAERWMGK